MMRLIACWTMAVTLGVGLGVTALAQEPKPRFEVTSVRPVRTPSSSRGPWLRPGGAVSLPESTVASLIVRAYGIEWYRAVGAPDWLIRDRFDVEARAASDVSEANAKLMLQSLLEDRFKLVSHEETRDLKYYALVRARADGDLGPYLRQFDDVCTFEMSQQATKQFPPRPPDFIGEDGRPRMNINNGACSKGFADMARSMTEVFRDLPVIDETGLGVVTYQMRYPATGDIIADVKAGLEDQLGLTLTVKRGPVVMRVIDSVQRPSEN